MKVLLEFDHSKKCVLEAMGCEYNNEQANDIIKDICTKYMEEGHDGRLSTLAELLHNELPYDLILFIATSSLRDKLEHLMMKRALREFLDMDDDESI